MLTCLNELIFSCIRNKNVRMKCFMSVSFYGVYFNFVLSLVLYSNFLHIILNISESTVHFFTSFFKRTFFFDSSQKMRIHVSQSV